MNNENEYLSDQDPEKNLDFYRQDHGGFVTNHNGVADKLLQNDKLYQSMKGDWKRTDLSGSKNIITTTGRENGKFYIRREQLNAEAIAEHCKEYTYRYGKVHKVESSGLLTALADHPNNLTNPTWTEPPSAMDAKYIISSVPTDNYRNYYKYGKAHLHKWKNRQPPEWIYDDRNNKNVING